MLGKVERDTRRDVLEDLLEGVQERVQQQVDAARCVKDGFEGVRQGLLDVSETTREEKACLLISSVLFRSLARETSSAKE